MDDAEARPDHEADDFVLQTLKRIQERKKQSQPSPLATKYTFVADHDSCPSSCPSADQSSCASSADSSPEGNKGDTSNRNRAADADALMQLPSFRASAMARQVPPLVLSTLLHVSRTQSSPAASSERLEDQTMIFAMEKRLEELAFEGEELDDALQSLRQAMNTPAFQEGHRTEQPREAAESTGALSKEREQLIFKLLKVRETNHIEERREKREVGRVCKKVCACVCNLFCG